MNMYEIIYDKSGKEIGQMKLDNNSIVLSKSINRLQGYHWIQYPEDIYNKRILFDSQIKPSIKCYMRQLKLKRILK